LAGRILRIAFLSLSEYHKKTNRSAFVIFDVKSQAEFARGLQELTKLKSVTASLDRKISSIVGASDVSESDLRILATTLPEVLIKYRSSFISVREHFARGMRAVGQQLDAMWGDDRYVRSAPGEVIE
jgi:hypothetical protein